MDTERRETIAVSCGGVTIGGGARIKVQTMTNTATDDVESSVEQCLRCAEAGAELVRLTAQGVHQVESIGRIRESLRERGCTVPLVADIHFNRNAAMKAAELCDGVRINPGNFADPARSFKQLEYTDEEYAAELARIREALLPFIKVCRERGTAVRLGVNHGSLSDRIMSRYGNTAAGMVESVMEYLRVFVAEGFDQVVISMKASNVVVMVESVRRLVAAMDAEGMRFPLHLGVTEAGFGEDGRIKSAVGIGALLLQGLGDTIRVSLSEDPELEIPVAQKLVDYVHYAHTCHGVFSGGMQPDLTSLTCTRRQTRCVAGLVGGNCQPVVIASGLPSQLSADTVPPDFFFTRRAEDIDADHRFIVPADQWNESLGDNVYPKFTPKIDDDWEDFVVCRAPIVFVRITVNTYRDSRVMDYIRLQPRAVVLVDRLNSDVLSQMEFMQRMSAAEVNAPVVLLNSYATDDADKLPLEAGADCGLLLLSGFGDGLWLGEFRLLSPPLFGIDMMARLSFAILQAARLRTTATEFISCPSCGRTLFDLQSTVKEVKAATSHLTHLKIAVMGCIVNGPGEMADADYGYVGAAPGRVSLYHGKQLVEANIPTAEAIPRLIALIKQCGDWRE